MTQSKWTHNICAHCWNKLNPDRETSELAIGIAEICCYCGEETSDGIYIRDDPNKLRCKGEHK